MECISKVGQPRAMAALGSLHRIPSGRVDTHGRVHTTAHPARLNLQHVADYASVTALAEDSIDCIDVFKIMAHFITTENGAANSIWNLFISQVACVQAPLQIQPSSGIALPGTYIRST